MKQKKYEREILFKSESGNIEIDTTGSIREIKILDQFGDDYKELKKEFRTAEWGICGYIVCAVAQLLSEHINKKILEKEEIDALLESLHDPATFLPYARQAMEFIQSRRITFKETHQPVSSPWMADYEMNWVSNIEISDYIKELNNHNVHFIRFNQVWEREQMEGAMHAGDPLSLYELHRLDEELLVLKIPSDQEEYFIERSSPNMLLTTDEWRLNAHLEGNEPFILIVDLRGHYAVFLNVIIGGDTILFLLNSQWTLCAGSTVHENYIHKDKHKQFIRDIYTLLKP